MKKAILIHSRDFERDKAILEKYSSVLEHELYKEVRGYGSDGQWHLLIVEERDWRKICKKHKINFFETFSERKTRLFFVKVTKCSNFCCPENKKFIGKTMQVMIDPVNDQYFTIYPPLPIQSLCHSDGKYSRKGYVYGIHVDDCVRVNENSEKLIAEGWTQLRKSLPKKAPKHLTLKSLNKISQLCSV